jgi:hypothetical protein
MTRTGRAVPATWPANRTSPSGRSTRFISAIARRSPGMAHNENVQTTVSKEPPPKESACASASRRSAATSMSRARRGLPLSPLTTFRRAPTPGEEWIVHGLSATQGRLAASIAGAWRRAELGYSPLARE